MEIKKVSTNDVYKVIKEDLKEVFKKLQNLFGDDNPFARFEVGYGFYVWTHDSDAWKPLTEASEVLESQVRDALLKAKDLVASKVSKETLERLFQIPDDSYIYYTDEGGEIKVLLTGWGFKRPVRYWHKGDNDKEPVKTQNEVTVSFLYDGKPIPNHDFALRTDKTENPQRTDENGKCNLGNTAVGKIITLVDTESKQEYQFEVIEGQSDYEWDLTRFSRVEIHATFDGQPITGETVQLNYNGETTQCTTDANGKAHVQLVYHQSKPIEATLREHVITEVIQPNGNTIRFDLMPEIIEADVHVAVKEGGEPVPNMPVKVNYGGQSLDGVTDAQGLCSFHVTIVPDATCEVSADGYTPQSKALAAEGENLFVLDKEKAVVPTPPPYDPKVRPRIRVEGNKGFVASKYPISVEYGGQTLFFTTDDNGIVQLPEMRCGHTMKVADGLHADNTADFIIEEKKDEYLFHVPFEPNIEPKEIKVMIRDPKGMPIKCDKVIFRQEGTERLMQMDGQGDTYFSEDTFKVGPEIETQLIGSGKDYGIIRFTLEEGENEYLLQEIAKKTSPWIIALEVLTVLACIAVLACLWPYLIAFFDTIFQMIY